MNVEMKVVINGRPCSKVFQKNDIIVYSVDNCDSSEEILYFAKGEKVLFMQTINADCGQNTGFISGIDYEGFN